MLLPLGSEGCWISPLLVSWAALRSASLISAVPVVAGRVWVTVVLLLSGGCSKPVEGFEVAAEDQVGELGAGGGRQQAGVLALEVTPRLVGGEQDAVVPDPVPFDLAGQPAGGEADGPTGVGVDAFAGRDPGEELRADELDVAAHPPAHVHQVDRDLV